MNNISTLCPRCRFSLEIPADFDNVICRGCATSYWVRRHGDALNLSEIWPDDKDGLLKAADPGPVVEQRLADIAELVEEAEIQIESRRSREQSAPLQMGCAFFGIFMTVIVVSALFMLLGKSYLGSWMFYVSIAAVILLGLMRIKRKLVSPAQREALRDERVLMEESLARLEAERVRIEKLKTFLTSEEIDNKGPAD